MSDGGRTHTVTGHSRYIPVQSGIYLEGLVPDIPTESHLAHETVSDATGTFSQALHKFSERTPAGHQDTEDAAL